LKASGAILLSKTTTREFGWKSATDSPVSGVSRNHGIWRAAAVDRRVALPQMRVFCVRRQRLKPPLGGSDAKLRISGWRGRQLQTCVEAKRSMGSMLRFSGMF
jgi:hypothetical protein